MITIYEKVTPDSNMRLFAVTVTSETALRGTPSIVAVLALIAIENEGVEASASETPDRI